MKCPTCQREKPKSNVQRRKFHAMCHDIGKFAGETPGKIKEAIKQDYFGMENYMIGTKWYKAVRPSESAQMAEYADLITYTLQWAAENLNYVIEDKQ